MIDLISLLLFALTLVLVLSMIFLDLSVYKYHYLFAIIALGVLIYTYGMIYQVDNPNMIDTVLKAFGNTSQVMRGIFRTSDIIDRINNDVLFLVSAYAIHIIGFGYTYILIFAIFFKNLGLRMRFFFQKSLPHFLILGSDERINYVLSTYEKDYKKPWLFQQTKNRRINLALPKALLAKKDIKTQYNFKPGVVSFDIDQQSIESLFSSRQDQVTLVSLLTEDADVLSLVKQLNRYYASHPQSKTKTYILYENQAYVRVYESFNQAKQHIQFFSYHQIVAQQLILDFPLTSIIPQTYIEQKKATLNDVAIAYHFVGFNDTSKEIYKHLYVTNQFPPVVSKFFGKEIVSYETKPIQYHIYALQEDAYADTYRFHYPTSARKDFLPFPPISASTSFVPVSALNHQIIEALGNQSLNHFDFHTFIVAAGDDVVNIALLQQLKAFLYQQRLLSKSKIFVQVLQKDYVEHSALFQDDHVIPFGFGEYAYSLKQIVNPVFNKIAEHIQQTLQPQQPFSTLSTAQKESYLYEAISLRFKLNLIGLDLSTQEKGLSKQAFLSLYDPYGEKELNRDHLRAKNDADLDVYKPLTRKKRNLLARQEHLRWSAYHLTLGYTPMAITDIIQRKNYINLEKKEDARLTSFEGLFDLHTLLTTKADFKFADADMIYPFFHTMDHLYTILQGTPYKVVDVINLDNNRTVELTLDTLPTVVSKIKES